MVYIIHKILVSIKNHLNYLKVNIFECFFKKLFFLNNFFITYNSEKSKAVRRKNN